MGNYSPVAHYLKSDIMLLKSFWGMVGKKFQNLLSQWWFHCDESHGGIRKKTSPKFSLGDLFQGGFL